MSSTNSAAPSSRSLRRPARLRTKVLALLLGVLLSGLVLELVVLVALGEQPKFPRHVVSAPWGLRINQPSTVYRHKSADGTFIFRINSKGLRADHEYPYAKPKGTKRIISLGDSFTVGYEVQVEECFSSVLERELGRRGHSVEVINAGVSGFSNAEEVLYFERELIKYAPDAVLLSFFTNDLEDNVRTGLFALEKGTLVPRRESYVPAGRLGDFLNTNPLFNFLAGYSNAFVLLKEQTTRIVKRQAIKQNEANEEQASDSKQEGEGDERTRDQQRLAAAILDRLYDYAHQRGINVIIQSLPSGGYASAYDYRPLHDVFPYEDFDANRPGLAILRMVDVLRPYEGKKQIKNLRSHFHWTPFAHKLSGGALAALIHERGLLEPPSPQAPPPAVE